MWSLQRRIVLGGLFCAVLAVAFGGIALQTVFNQIADRRFNDVLREQHLQLIVVLGNSGAPEDVEAGLALPAYGRPYSGRYWQISSADGRITTSPSLFDFELELPLERAVGFWEGEGPQSRIRGYTERVMSADDTPWIATVAASLDALDAERAEMGKSVALAFSFVALLGLGCAAFLTTMLLAPLRQLRHDVVHRWDAGTDLDPETYPAEVAPLVSDINELIQRNRQIHERGRRQAADLAHALKTPSAAMRNELQFFSARGLDTSGLLEALDRIDAQIGRSLGRMRAASAEDKVSTKTHVATSLSRIERLFRTIPVSDGKDFEVQPVEGRIAMDQQDFEEILGNLLENAFKWCDTTVRVSSRHLGNEIEISVEDDGPGICPDMRQAVLDEGKRLDTSMPGTGIGLSIVSDLTQAYGGTLELVVSKELGGLHCRLTLPVSARVVSLVRKSA